MQSTDWIKIIIKKIPSYCVYQPQCDGISYYLAFRRVRIVSVGVTGTDLTVLSMGEAFRLLIPGNLPCNSNGFLLCSGSNRCPGITGTLNLPASVGMWSNMLIPSSHIMPPPERADRTVVQYSRATVLCDRFVPPGVRLTKLAFSSA